MQTRQLPDNFQYLRFLGDHPGTPPSPLPAKRADAASRSLVKLENDSVFFFEKLCGAWGLSASRYRDSIFARRQAACLRSLRAASPGDGARLIGTDSEASERALGAVMIGVTEFFRDPAVFEALRPMLGGLRRVAEPLRALSIGCSDGSELYSLAILLAEEGMLSDAWLHGVDCRPAAIRSAMAGVYTAAALDALAPALRARYFQDHRITLRDHCRWSVGDAFNLPPEVDAPGTRDLVLCRNLAIYLNLESAAELWGRCVAQLRPGGLLVTGKAERPPGRIRSDLERVGPCIYRRKVNA